MHILPPALVSQLSDLIGQFRADSQGFLENPQDVQQWYNRGYANGMVRGLSAVMGERLPEALALDDPAPLQTHAATDWGKAYRHGESVGEKELYEMTGTH